MQTVNKSEFQKTESILDLLTHKTNFYSSRGEARRAIQQNAVAINTVKVFDAEDDLSQYLTLEEEQFTLQKGKTTVVFDVTNDTVD